jgi:hypothetical protein
MSSAGLLTDKRDPRDHNAGILFPSEGLILETLLMSPEGEISIFLSVTGLRVFVSGRASYAGILPGPVEQSGSRRSDC